MNDTISQEGRESAESGSGTLHHRRREDVDMTGYPPGWTYNPSAWRRRAPLLVLALINLGIASYLALCELGVFARPWDPFFGNGTYLVLNSSVSRAFPVPDALLGAGAYLLEIAALVFGGTQRWRTHPWIIFGFVLVTIPLWLISVTLLILQPVIVHAWCTLCLIAAACMLLLAPLGVDEVVAATEAVVQAGREGQPWWQALLHGTTSKTNSNAAPADQATRPFQGFSIPWNLAVCLLLGLWMLISPSILESRGVTANSDRVVGILVLSLAMLSCAEVARPVRFLVTACGVWLLVFAPWSLPFTSGFARLNEVLVGIGLIVCSAIRTRLREHYGVWDRYII